MVGGLIFMLISALGGILYGLFSLFWVILMIIAYWKVLVKAGEPGWKCLIPIYNGYTFYKIAWNADMFWIGCVFIIMEAVFRTFSGGMFSVMGILAGLCGVAQAVINFFYSVNLAKCFGKGILFGIGIWIAGPIFILILAFGSARYQRGSGTWAGY